MLKEKIVLIGAGSAMFTRGIVVDLVNQNQEAELALVDIDEQALNVAKRFSEKYISQKNAKIKLSSSMNRKDVLKGATSVICSIGVGGRRAWEQDVFIPRKYGIYQPVGDTVGPGGTSRALRMIPAMVAIAEDVLELAPDALFFNYSNPMAVICRAIRKKTGVNMIGLCTGMHDILQYMAKLLKTNPENLGFGVAGMNHLMWLWSIRVNGKEMIQKLNGIAAEKLAEAETSNKNIGINFTDCAGYDPNSTKNKYDDINPFTWKLFQLFGAYPVPGDRHITEFFPQLFVAQDGQYYGKKLGVDAYTFEGTVAYGDQIYDELKTDMLSDKPLSDDYFKKIGGEHEQVIEIIESIRKDKGLIYSANCPNTGQIPNLPQDAIVEGHAIADASGIHLIQQSPLPSGIAGSLATRMQWVETVVEAALEGDKNKVVQALIIDGAVNSIDMAERLTDELLSAHKEYLPQFNR